MKHISCDIQAISSDWSNFFIFAFLKVILLICVLKNLYVQGLSNNQALRTKNITLLLDPFSKEY